MLGQRPVDVRALGCHAMAASGRKWLRGPRGTAVLYARRDFLAAHPAFMADQLARPRRDARSHEQGEAGYAGRLALGVAIQGRWPWGSMRLRHGWPNSRSVCVKDCAPCPGWRWWKAAMISPPSSPFTSPACPRRALADLSAQGLRIGTMGAIYAPLDMAARGLDAVLRAAPQTYTSESEIDTLLQAVAGLTVTA
jgi:selenocysteine lyase/cysteine desulfurase